MSLARRRARSIRDAVGAWLLLATCWPALVCVCALDAIRQANTD